MATTSGSLITRNYTGFKGVDFSNRKDEIALYRSPDALNMWRNYKNTKIIGIIKDKIDPYSLGSILNKY